MVLITIVTGAYKPTNIIGGPHIVVFNDHLTITGRVFSAKVQLDEADGTIENGLGWMKTP